MMGVQVSKQFSAASSLEKQTLLLSRSQTTSQLPINQYLKALEGKLNNLIDGVLILTEKQELIYANDNAYRVLRQLNSNKTEKNAIPHEIWYICQSLINSRSLFPHQYWFIESEIFTSDVTALHVRARWLQVETLEHPCLLLTIEDRYQALKNLALEKAQKYGLTPREKEVWMLHCANYSYKQIAEELQITPNTVKKHMSSIHVKQKEIATQFG
uniref:LuxR family transcriptional regulator n=1 Tax=Oscillatoriales cyanobacterium SpSt-418 TaxID=2282169 RepID=A0A7C3KIV5_9CYAN